MKNKDTEKVKKSCTVFVDLEKACNMAPREEELCFMRKSGVAEVRVLRDMNEDSVIAVRYAIRMADGFKVNVAVHQRSALRPFLFVVVMDKLIGGIRQEDFVVCYSVTCSERVS